MKSDGKVLSITLLHRGCNHESELPIQDLNAV